MRKLIACTAVLLVTAAGVAACGSGSKGSSLKAFCAQASDADSVSSNLDIENDKDLDQTKAVINDLADAAPNDITADMNLVADAYAEAVAEAKKVKDPTERLTVIAKVFTGNQAFAKAVQRVDKFATKECNIDLGLGSATGPGSGSSSGRSELSDFSELTDFSDLSDLGFTDLSNYLSNLSDLSRFTDLSEFSDLSAYSDFLSQLSDFSGLSGFTDLSNYSDYYSDLSSLTDLSDFSHFSSFN